MPVLNYTPHEIVLITDETDLDYTEIRIPSSGRAQVAMFTGARRHEEGCPVPVCLPATFGQLGGLPASVMPGDVIVVSAVAAAAGEREYRSIIERGFSDEETSRRLAVLRALVTPGHGSDSVRFTESDVETGRCNISQFGQVRGVRALVRAFVI